MTPSRSVGRSRSLTLSELKDKISCSDMRIIVLMHAAAAAAGHKFGPIRHFVTGPMVAAAAAVGPFSSHSRLQASVVMQKLSHPTYTIRSLRIE